MSYCKFAKGHPIHSANHDHEYGFPIADDNQLFERLVLEINQAGLWWETILKKRDAFREAYAGIIRNRMKIDAAIENARRLVALGSFAVARCTRRRQFRSRI